MAYDLLTKTIVPINCSRDGSLGPILNRPTAMLLIVGGAALVKAALTEMSRKQEKAHYQSEFRPGLHQTQEMPAMSMRELVVQSEE